MRLGLALRGDLRDFVARDLEQLEQLFTGRMRTTIRGFEKDLEAATASAGLGRLSRAWASKVYPKGQNSLGPAGFVYPKGGARTEGAMLAFTQGAVIRSNRGVFLAIPTDNAPAKGVGRGRISPSNWPTHRYGPLRFVYRRGGASLLVVDNVRASFARGSGALRGFRRASQRARQTGSGLTSVVMFVLVPQARIKQRVDVRGITARWEERLYRGLVDDLFTAGRGPTR